MFVPCEQCPLRRRAVFRPFSENELVFISEMKTDHIAVAPRADIIREEEVEDQSTRCSKDGRSATIDSRAAPVKSSISFCPGTRSDSRRWFWAELSTPSRQSQRLSVFSGAEAFPICLRATQRLRSTS